MSQQWTGRNSDAPPPPIDLSRHGPEDRIFTCANTPGYDEAEVAALNQALRRLILHGARASLAKILIAEAVAKGIFAEDMPYVAVDRFFGWEP